MSLTTQELQKISHGAGKFSQNLLANKNLWYNERNCKSERHSQQHTFMHYKSQNRATTTNMLNLGLQVEARNKVETKLPSPCKHNWMICAVNRRQNASHQESKDVKQPFLSYGEPDQCNDYISKDLSYIVCFCTNFPCHCVLGQVPLDTILFNTVVLRKKVVQPTKEPGSVGPYKSKPKKITSKKQTH